MATTAVTGGVSLGAVLVLVETRAPLGSPLFFLLAAVLGLAFVAMLARVWSEPATDRRALGLALLVAILLRLPLALAPVGADSDMERYLWDGRVQRLGYNPYAVLPADPALAGTHTADSARMPSRRAHTPYPPGAQLFFRLVVSVSDSLVAMKLALLAADVAIILILRRWLAATGRSAWLALAYAWNPVVILEVAHSGHIDALGAMWIVLAALFLSERRPALATVAFVLAISTKLLPIVLAPLFLGRIGVRHAVLGAALLGFLYLPFLSAGGSSLAALGAVPNVVDYIRFNGPVFHILATLTSGRAAAAVALAAGLSVALACRMRRQASDPDAWAWPMAAALAAAPVIYPWYLLFLTPFLWTRRTLPLLAWCFSGLAAYVVWEISRRGGRWIVPNWVQLIEYAVPVAACALLLARRRQASTDPAEVAPAR